MLVAVFVFFRLKSSAFQVGATFQPSATLNLAREIEKCGVAALGVHGRRRDERDPHPCRIDEIREVARTVSVPVIAK